MKFTTDELKPFSEVRTELSNLLVVVQAGKEIVITRHGKPIAALVSASQLYQYRELDRAMAELLSFLDNFIAKKNPDDKQKILLALTGEVGKFLTKKIEREGSKNG